MHSGVEIIAQGIDYDGWRLGIQVAVDGRLAPMFDLHKSVIADAGDGSLGYEKLLERSARELLTTLGPAKVSGVPAASSR